MKPSYFLCCILLGTLQTALSQSSDFFEKSFTEETPDQERFSMYLDSIDKYLYRDILIAESALEECERLVEQGIELPDSLAFEFILQQIYLQHSKAAPLEAYRIIADYENSLDSFRISHFHRSTFEYIKGFTYMAVGDLEAAQMVYYENLNAAEARKDFQTMIKSLFSLGQLYIDEKEYEEAHSCFRQILDFEGQVYIRPSTMALVYLELGESLTKLEQYDKALEIFQKAYHFSEENGLGVLSSDALLEMGNLYLEENKVEAANRVYHQLLNIEDGSLDQNIKHNIERLLALLYRAQGRYASALKTYRGILERAGDTDVENKMETLGAMHGVCKEMGDFELAYDYLLAFNEVKKEREEDAKKQKTAYLKIKFDSEQKEKENAALNMSILENRAESRLLYLWLASSFLVLLFLVGAFYQKRRYSKKLEHEVVQRTVRLKNSNRELNEFNRILSHDLREPLRSIVGFSQLAKKKTAHDKTVQEYLEFITAGGKQLERLIESINLFRKANSVDPEAAARIDMRSLVEEIVRELKANHPDKQFEVECSADVPILGHGPILNPVVRILLDNAARYNERATVSIRLKHYFENGFHHFEITDNGMGIAPDFRDQVFDMFKRLNNRRNHPGAGLGLSIARKLMKKIGGNVTILRSKENEGTTFLVRFPAVNEFQPT